MREMPIKKDLHKGGLFIRRKWAQLAVMNMLTRYCSSVSYDTRNETEGREARWLQSFPAFSPLKTVHLACLKRREKKPPFFVVAISGL